MSPDHASWRPTHLLLTCEHGGHDVPVEHRALFREADAALLSHRGWDPGALDVALQMAARLSAPIVFSTVTRLLVDLNRSVGNPDVFSEFSRDLPEAARSAVLAAHYHPHRRRVETCVSDAVRSGGRMLHVGVHSFTDQLGSEVRELDVALLFDPARSAESSLCERWHRALVTQAPELRHRFNEPYQGIDDGLTTTLRTRFANTRYAGIEIEARQGLLATPSARRRVAILLAESLASVISAGP